MALRRHPTAIVAYPLRCTNYLYFRGRMADAGHGLIVVSLDTAYETIVHTQRGRAFSADEQARIAEMLAQGFGFCLFCVLVVDTGAGTFDATADLLVARLRPRLG